jgi:hypothetical protein
MLHRLGVAPHVSARLLHFMYDRVGGQPMLMTDETFIASILFSIPFIRMFQKLGVTHIDPQSQQLTPGSAPSPHQKPLDEKAA